MVHASAGAVADRAAKLTSMRLASAAHRRWPGDFDFVARALLQPLQGVSGALRRASQVCRLGKAGKAEIE